MKKLVKVLELVYNSNGEILNQAVDVDFNEIKDDLLELRHIKDGKITIVEVYE